MVDAGQQLRGVGALVRLDPADRDAAESDAVIPAQPSDEPRPRRLALRLEVGHRDLERGVDRLGARVREEHVVQIAGEHLAHALGEREADGMPHLESGREVERGRCFLHRSHDRLSTMASVHAPQPRRAIENAAPIHGRVVHPARGREHARRALERAVGRERHPELLERNLGPEHVGERGCLSHVERPSEVACRCLTHRMSPALSPVPGSRFRRSRFPIPDSLFPIQVHPRPRAPDSPPPRAHPRARHPAPPPRSHRVSCL